MDNENSNNIESLFENATDFIQTNVELTKLKAIKKSSDILSNAGSKLVLAMIVLTFFIMLHIGIALWLGALFGKIYLGFFAVAIFYLLLFVIVYANRKKWLVDAMANSIIKQITK